MSHRAAGLVVDAFGSGPSLLLLHGLSANRSTWYEVAERLRGEFTVLLPDLLGRGESRAPQDARFGIVDELARLSALLEGRGIDACFVAGHSHGAALAVGLAAGAPAVTVRGLVLVNAVTPWTVRPRILGLLGSGAVRRVVAPALSHFREPVTRYILDRRVLPPGQTAAADMIARYAAPFAERGRAEVFARVLADWRPGELLPLAGGRNPGLRVPTHVLAGDHDRRIGSAEARRLAEWLGGRFTLLEGGHALPEERPDEVAGACREVAMRAAERDAAPERDAASERDGVPERDAKDGPDGGPNFETRMEGRE